MQHEVILISKNSICFSSLVDVLVLTDVPVLWKMSMSVEDLISQSPSESEALKVLDLPAELLVWLRGTVPHDHTN